MSSVILFIAMTLMGVVLYYLVIKPIYNHYKMKNAPYYIVVKRTMENGQVSYIIKEKLVDRYNQYSIFEYASEEEARVKIQKLIEKRKAFTIEKEEII